MTLGVMAQDQKSEQNTATWEIGNNCLQVQFYTPSIVRIVKYPKGSPQPGKSLVVIANPEAVPVTRQGNSVSSQQLTVKVNPTTGTVSFHTTKGKILLQEKKYGLTPITTGNDAGQYQVQQVFTLDKDEAVYGLGTVQDGKLNRRGLHKLMEQSNLEDFQNVLQSIKGWGLYWDNY